MPTFQQLLQALFLSVCFMFCSSLLIVQLIAKLPHGSTIGVHQDAGNGHVFVTITIQ